MSLVALTGLLALFALSIFQLLLILGKPLGEFAWGGQHKILPKRLRVASATSIVLYLVFALFLASKAGIMEFMPNSQFIDIGMWVFTGYFILGVFMNAVSRNKKERALMTPVALLLAVVFLLTALG
jgi:surface polysaccharide O-acyltransferase-like enzyme